MGGIKMKKTVGLLSQIVLVLGIISVIAVFIDSFILNYYTEELVMHPDLIMSVEVAVVIAAVILGGFIILSMIWVASIKGDKGRFSPGKIFTLIFGLVCLAVLFVEKFMADEVAYRMLDDLGFEQQMSGLQMLFVLQLVYSLLIIVEVTAQNSERRMKRA